jgi:hypothetical protein
VVFEPQNRGILTVVPLNDTPVIHIDEYTEKGTLLIKELNGYLTQSDVENIETFYNTVNRN